MDPEGDLPLSLPLSGAAGEAQSGWALWVCNPPPTVRVDSPGPGLLPHLAVCCSREERLSAWLAP